MLHSACVCARLTTVPASTAERVTAAVTAALASRVCGGVAPACAAVAAHFAAAASEADGDGCASSQQGERERVAACVCSCVWGLSKKLLCVAAVLHGSPPSQVSLLAVGCWRLAATGAEHAAQVEALVDALLSLGPGNDALLSKTFLFMHKVVKSCVV